MEASNIIGDSNVYPCMGNPLEDQKFVKQIKDYEKIKVIYKRQEAMQSAIQLNDEQKQLLQIEMRCIYAPNDPCWGYVTGKGIKCKCVKGQCPNIKKCNPNYTKEQSAYWMMTKEDKIIYGFPEKQRKYYLVDLASEEEMKRYISDPKGAGSEFSIIPDLEDLEEIKPKEREKVIIGYEDIYFGDADNQLSPIWGYVDDAEDIGTIVANRYGRHKEHVQGNARKVHDEKKRIEKNNNQINEEKIRLEKEQKKPIITMTCEEQKIAYEKCVKDKIETSHQLMEIIEEIINGNLYGKILNIVLSNEAEMAYVSSMLLKTNIAHCIESCKRDEKKHIYLWKAQSKNIQFLEGMVFISETFVKQGCSIGTEEVWEKLKDISKIEELLMNGRDFFEFEGTDKQQRWGCKNLYGATHLVVHINDFELATKIEKEKEIFLEKDDQKYIIKESPSEEQIGITNNKFWGALEGLKRTNQITDFPRIIEGIVLVKSEKNYEIKGLGHMKFDEY